MNETSGIFVVLFLGMIVFCLAGLGRELSGIRKALEDFLEDEELEDEEEEEAQA